MTQWWNALSVNQQILFVIACATTLFMVGQIIMMLIGMGDSDTDVDADTGGLDTGDTDADGDGDGLGHGSGFTVFGLKILTVRSIIAFFCIGSWMAFTMEYFMHWSLALVIGLVCGLCAAFLMAYVMHALMKLQSNGNIDIGNSVGAFGEVYLTVPARRGGEGKINLTLQERFVELRALTDCDESILTGSKVKVIGTAGESVIVEPTGDNTRLSENGM